MTKIDFQKVADAFEKTSKEMKDLMLSPELGSKLIDIAESNNLKEDDFPEVVDEVGYIILGLKPASGFEKSLTDMGIDKNLSSIISNRINDLIFSKLNTEKKPVPKLEPEKVIPVTTSDTLDVSSLQKIVEITQKYGLNNARKDSLVRVVESTIKNPQERSTIISSIQKELSVSSVMAEQIKNDLEKRVLSQPIKTPEVKKEPPKPPVEKVEVKTEQKVETKIPEKKPDYLPGEEMSHVDEIFKNQKIEVPRIVPTAPKIEMTKTAEGEFVQRPPQVPRIISNIKDEVENPAPPVPVAPKIEPKNIVDNKLNSTVVSKKEETPIKKDYTVDPYRESLE